MSHLNDRALRYTFEHPEYEVDYDYEYEPEDESECISEYRDSDPELKDMTDEQLLDDPDYLESDFRKDWFYDEAYEAFRDDDDVLEDLADQCSDSDPNSSWDAPWGWRY